MPRVPSEAAAKVGRMIGERRRTVGLSQDQLAAGSGIDSSNIRAYENGRAMPNVQSLVRIAYALGLRPGALIDELSPELFAAPENDGRRKTGR